MVSRFQARFRIRDQFKAYALCVSHILYLLLSGRTTALLGISFNVLRKTLDIFRPLSRLEIFFTKHFFGVNSEICLIFFTM